MPGPCRLVTTTTIVELAYRFWQQRGCPEGSPEADWLRAEKELQTLASDQPDSLLIAIARSTGAFIGGLVRQSMDHFASARSHHRT